MVSLHLTKGKWIGFCLNEVQLRPVYFSNSCARLLAHVGCRIWALFEPTLYLVLLVQIWTNNLHFTSWSFDPHANHLGCPTQIWLIIFFSPLIWGANCDFGLPCYPIFMLSCFILLPHFNFQLNSYNFYRIYLSSTNIFCFLKIIENSKKRKT